MARVEQPVSQSSWPVILVFELTGGECDTSRFTVKISLKIIFKSENVYSDELSRQHAQEKFP